MQQGGVSCVVPQDAHAGYHHPDIPATESARQHHPSYLPHLSGVQFGAAAHGRARATLPRRRFALLREHIGTAGH